MNMAPRITVSYAQSLDGRIATSTGDSRWISSPGSLTLAHKLRRDHEIILVGIGTVLRDDPELSCRLKRRTRLPVRVILDSQLRLPLESKIMRTSTTYKTMVYTLAAGDSKSAGGAATIDVPERGDEAKDAPETRRATIERSGIEVCEVPADLHGRVSAVEVVKDLGKRGYQSIFVEGGARVITSFLLAGLVGRLVVVTAPIVIGRGIEAIGDLGITELSRAMRPRRSRVRRIGRDHVWELVF